jgi:hypothetical protein
MKKFLMLMAIATTTFTACKKSDDAPSQLDVTMANIAGVYRLTGVISVEGGLTYDRFNGGTIGGMAYPSDYENCEKDDTFTFTASGNVTSAEGATSCIPPTASQTATYTVQTSTKTLSIPLFGLTGNIESLTSAGMVFKQTTTSGGLTIVETYTFSR